MRRGQCASFDWRLDVHIPVPVHVHVESVAWRMLFTRAYIRELARTTRDLCDVDVRVAAVSATIALQACTPSATARTTQTNQPTELCRNRTNASNYKYALGSCEPSPSSLQLSIHFPLALLTRPF